MVSVPRTASWKEAQNMMQMSGGEKALTAIALLFAIQNLKPSPFCLLDEIEAALDDSNVDRYAKYLHKLTKHTQFIVITHPARHHGGRQTGFMGSPCRKKAFPRWYL